MSGIKRNVYQKGDEPSSLEAGHEYYVARSDGTIEHYIGATDGTPVLVSGSRLPRKLIARIGIAEYHNSELFVNEATLSVSTGNQGYGPDTVVAVISGLPHDLKHVEINATSLYPRYAGVYASPAVEDSEANPRAISHFDLYTNEGDVEIVGAQVKKNGERKPLPYQAKDRTFDLYVYGYYQ